MRNHGTDPRVRMAVLQERVEAMKAIWRDETATYKGRFVSFDRIWSYPKPVQRPHPPILVGGSGPSVLDRVLSFGTAWFPNYDESIFPRIDELRARTDRPIDVQVLSAPADPAVLQRLHEAGVQRASRWLPSAPKSTVERALDRWEQAIAEFAGEQA
jgi:alkanesulfonate monooxygenase SsuD/methylene tetrahydromethanopterin reductase-like flavin-dependent oxidoreductase (luciferase family)